MDDLAVDLAGSTHGLALAYQDGPARKHGLELLAKARERAANNRVSVTNLPLGDVHIAREKARTGDIAGAIELARTVVDDVLGSGGCIWIPLAASVLVDAPRQAPHRPDQNGQPSRIKCACRDSPTWQDDVTDL